MAKQIFRQLDILYIIQELPELYITTVGFGNSVHTSHFWIQGLDNSHTLVRLPCLVTNILLLNLRQYPFLLINGILLPKKHRFNNLCHWNIIIWIMHFFLPIRIHNVLERVRVIHQMTQHRILESESSSNYIPFLICIPKDYQPIGHKV